MLASMQGVLLLLLLLAELCLSLRCALSAIAARQTSLLRATASEQQLLTSSYSQSAAYKSTQGEDAHFVLDGDLGVFDGVSDWSKKGVDAGEYSRELSRSVASYIQRDRVEKKKDFIDLIGALSYCVSAISKSNNVTGSCTACIASLHPKNRVLSIANLGDSSGAVYRYSGSAAHTVFRTKPMQHSYNTPFQIGHYARPVAGGKGSGEGGQEGGGSVREERSYFFDRPFDSTLDYVPLQRGDVVLLSSDGLTDNLFPHEIEEVIGEVVFGREAPTDMKQRLDACVAQLVALATRRMADREADSPWSEAATLERTRQRQPTLVDKIFNRDGKYASLEVRGGKPDDLTIIVSYY